MCVILVIAFGFRFILNIIAETDPVFHILKVTNTFCIVMIDIYSQRFINKPLI